MKTIPLLFAVLSLAGCVVSPDPEIVTVRSWPRSVSGTTLPPADTVRTPGVVKAFPIGRYRDAQDPRVMHEGHVIYVEEAAPTWDLRPHVPAFVPLGPAVAAPDAARAPAFAPGEQALDFNEQKRLLKSMNEQSRRFEEAVGQLNATVPLTLKAAEQVQQLDRQQRTMADRLQLLEEALRRPAPLATNGATFSTNRPAPAR